MLYSVTFHPVIHPSWSNEQGLEVFMSLVIIFVGTIFIFVLQVGFLGWAQSFSIVAMLQFLGIWISSSGLSWPSYLSLGREEALFSLEVLISFHLQKKCLSLSKNFMSITSQIGISRLLMPVHDLTWREICMASRTPHLGNKHIHTHSLSLWLLYSLSHILVMLSFCKI